MTRERPYHRSETINRILTAAAGRFGSKGLDATRIEDVARTAGVSKSLIYKYFSGKDDLYSAILSKMSFDNYDELLAIDYDELAPQDAVAAYLGVHFDQFRRKPTSTTIISDQMLHGGAQILRARDASSSVEQLLAAIESFLQRGHDDGIFARRMRASDFHFMAIVVTHGCVSYASPFKKYLGPEKVTDDLDYWRGFVLDFFLNTLGFRGR